MPAAVNAILELDRVLADWSADTTQSDEPDRVRVTLRSMIVRLGELAVHGAEDRAEIVAPYVEAVLEARGPAPRAPGLGPLGPAAGSPGGRRDRGPGHA